MLCLAAALLSGVAAAASRQTVKDRRGDSKSGVPGNDIVSASAHFAGGRLTFKVTNAKLPKGLHPPCVEIYKGTSVGCAGNATVETNTRHFKCKRRTRGNTVTYSFLVRKLGGHPKEVRWRAAIMEGRAADLAPNRGYKRFAFAP